MMAPGHAGGNAMIAQELHPFPYQPQGPVPPSDASPPRRRRRWPLAALALAVVLGGTAIGAMAAGVLERGQATPLRRRPPRPTARPRPRPAAAPAPAPPA